MTFKEFETMLLGADITIHINHKNITFTTAFNNRVICQLNFVEGFNPTYLHIVGDDNFLADMFSRLSRLSNMDMPFEALPNRESPASFPINNFSFLLDNNKLLECSLNLPRKNDLPFALDLQRIAKGQQNDQELTVAASLGTPITLSRTTIW
jgi:hypothetical protein